MQFVDIKDHRVCDNCRSAATTRLEGITGLLRVYLCPECVHRLRSAIAVLAERHPGYAAEPSPSEEVQVHEQVEMPPAVKPLRQGHEA